MSEILYFTFISRSFISNSSKYLCSIKPVGPIKLVAPKVFIWMNALNIFWAVIYHCSIQYITKMLSRRFWAIWYAYSTQCPEELCNRGVWSKIIIVKYTLACIDLKITLSIFDNALTFFLFTKCELTLFDSCLISLWSGLTLITS